MRPESFDNASVRHHTTHSHSIDHSLWNTTPARKVLIAFVVRLGAAIEPPQGTRVCAIPQVLVTSAGNSARSVPLRSLVSVAGMLSIS